MGTHGLESPCARGGRSPQLSEGDTLLRYSDLHRRLKGNVLAGSNPKFDADFLSGQRYAPPPRWPDISSYFDLAPAPNVFGQPWHHRMLDLSAYAAGVLNIPLDELPGLNVVCEQLGVVNEDPHSALGDARATAECFRRLRGDSHPHSRFPRESLK